MKLIGSLTSPYVRKARIVLAEKKLEYAFIADDVWSATTAIGQTNPLGKVPCLVLENGDVIHDSRVIVEYLDTLSPVGKLIPSSGRERAQVKTWEALADGVLDAAILARLESMWPGREAQQRSPAWIDRQLGKVRASLTEMSEGLGEQASFHGISLTLADIAVATALGYLDFRFPELDWRTSHPNLARFQAKMMQRPSFADTAPPT